MPTSVLENVGAVPSVTGNRMIRMSPVNSTIVTNNGAMASRVIAVSQPPSNPTHLSRVITIAPSSQNSLFASGSRLFQPRTSSFLVGNPVVSQSPATSFMLDGGHRMISVTPRPTTNPSLLTTANRAVLFQQQAPNSTLIASGNRIFGLVQPGGVQVLSCNGTRVAGESVTSQKELCVV
ncbi:unnamed protein product [Cyprideis torosa]|uniref:Uncharacterized protein n=1 Tax=Cyprideis torosa TaxID=163714 RepID=A0A7R8ZUT8_9CRUS|nr:unnamed protein product [Cyprideis torosa]CAG0901490.1 unnamed protein product [Cyprideis torosa]